MNYTTYDELTTIELAKNENSISIQRIAKILENRPASAVYCEQAGKLRGIISLGDVMRAAETGIEHVNINTHFIYLRKGQYMNARKIFDDKENIYFIPVVEQNDVLLGAYSRWDDLLFIANEEITQGGGSGCKAASAHSGSTSL